MRNILPSLATHPRFRTALVAAVLCGGTLALFSRSVGFGFLNYDDPDYVTGNRMVQAGLTWAGAVWAFTAPVNYWHPLAWLSHMLDWELHGAAPAGHHFTSVLWHAVNAVLAFLVFRRLAGGFWRSALAAALFAWHPLRVESVTWVTERKDVMSGCFFLLTLLAYARYAAARAAGRPAWRPYCLALAAFAAGLMSKPMVVTLPLLLLLLDAWPLGRLAGPRAWRWLLAEKLPFLLLSGGAAAATILMQREVGAFVLDLPLGARLENAVVSLARYLGKFAWPSGLSIMYPHPGSWPGPAVAAASALVLGLGAVAWWQRRTRPWIAVGLGWWLVTLLPVIGIIQVGYQAMADRYTYLPMLGVLLALVWSLPAASSRWRAGAASGAALLLLAACALRTWQQQRIWQDSVTLFSQAVRVDPRNDIAEDLLASAFFAEERYAEAAVHAARARALNPRNDLALVTLAQLAEREGRMDEAAALYRSALGLRPASPQVQGQLALLEYRRGRPDEARVLLTAALRAEPVLRERTLELAQAALDRNDPQPARELFEVVLAVWPDDPAAGAGAGLALLALGNPAAAIARLRPAAARADAPAEVLLALAGAAEQLAQADEAAGALARAESAPHAGPAALARAAELQARLRNFPAAIRLYRRALELAPADSRSHAALGYLLIHAGDRTGGRAEWRRALELDPNFPGLRERLQQLER